MSGQIHRRTVYLVECHYCGLDGEDCEATTKRNYEAYLRRLGWTYTAGAWACSLCSQTLQENER